MADLNVRSDAVDVEQIMKGIRARIREKRGADYTEAELQQLATVKLEKFLDPKSVRSDLVEQFRKSVVVPPAPNFEFGETTLYETHRGAISAIRKLFKPLLKLFFNPDKITSALHIQSQVNTQTEQRLRRMEERERLSYELLHNLTVELTRIGIEVHNLKMRAESLSSRMDFDERRARAFEAHTEAQRVAEPRRQMEARHAEPRHAETQRTAETQRPPQEQQRSAEPPRTDGGVSVASGGGPQPSQGPRGDGGRRRRRRRRRRPGQTFGDQQNQANAPGGPAGMAGAPADAGGAADDGGGDDGFDDDGGGNDGGADGGAESQ